MYIDDHCIFHFNSSVLFLDTLYNAKRLILLNIGLSCFVRILLCCMSASRGFKDMEDLNSLLRVIETDLATVEQKLTSHRAAHPSPAKLMVRVCVEVCFLLK